MSVPPNRERLLDLLVLQSTQGLSETETAELKAGLRAHPDLAIDEFDAAVAAVSLASESGSEMLPTALAEKIMAAIPETATNAPIPLATRTRSSIWASPAAGWWSAAACLVIAIAGWWPRIAGESATQMARVETPTLEAQRAAALESGRAIQVSWSPGNATDALVGDVVFDPVTQRGFLRFRGIPANDPRLEQYQLWIADAARTPPEPVDGGVFNTPQATATGDVIIPFEAKLPVGKPAAFVVTVEEPGGVVVSKQERVLAVAQVPTT